MHKVESRSDRPCEHVAQALREAPTTLDDFARARLERNLVDAWRVRGARAVPLTHVTHVTETRRFPLRGAWVLSVSLSVAAGIVLGLATLRTRDTGGEVSERASSLVAHFELVIDDGAVQSGYITEGQMLESGKHGRIEVGLAQSRIDIAPDSRVRFERLAPSEVRLGLVTGRVEVAFHPEHKGKDRMSVETRAARVIVVGTRFEVSANAAGDTSVSVSEGVVQVVPRRGGQARYLRAGEHVEIAAEEASERDRALRADIEARIAEEVAPEQALAEAEAQASAVDAETSEAREVRRDDAAPARKLEAARELLMHGKHGAARERLQKLAKSAAPTGARVEALTLMAESFTAQGQIPNATEAYREAVRIAPRHPAGYNALFALARLLERYTEDKAAAGASYRDYLARAPSGALAPQAREALCRLGDAASCR